MAELHNRRYIGVDISEEYRKIAQERIRMVGIQKNLINQA